MTTTKSSRIKRQKLAGEMLDLGCEFFGYTRKQVTSPDRSQPLCRERQIIMAVVVELCGITLREAGTLFGNRDPGTALHAIKMVKKREREHPPGTGDSYVFRKRALEKFRKQLPDKFLP